MSTPKPMASNGTITTPPPRPVSAPRKPASSAPSNSHKVITKTLKGDSPDSSRVSGGVSSVLSALPDLHWMRIQPPFHVRGGNGEGLKELRRIIEWTQYP